MARIVLGVGGGIAAYKSCELLRLFTEAGHRVRVVPTAAALNFVGAATWAALSGEPVATEVWADVHEVAHVRIGRSAELVMVAPATADLLAKAAHGLADDLLTTTLLTAGAPIIFAPAMHTEMWEHPATVANVATLRRRGCLVLEPAVGRLTGADSGKGRLSEPSELFAVALRVLARAAALGSVSSGAAGGAPGTAMAHAPRVAGVRAAGTAIAQASDASGGRAPDGLAPRDLVGRRVVVTAGGTQEPLDPVRYLGNRSSGRQGYALALAAVSRGAHVTLISANVSLPDPAGVEIVRVATTQELRSATLTVALDQAHCVDVVVMAAAPADFRPSVYAEKKIKKSDDGSAPTLSLVANPDIAAELGAAKPSGQLLVAFAAETGDGPRNAEAKLVKKNADLIVLNEVGPADDGRERVFGQPTNAVTIIGADGSRVEVSRRSKDAVAEVIWDEIVARLR